MKHLLTSLLFLLFEALPIAAQTDSVTIATVNLETAGTLSSTLKAQGFDLTKVTKLIVTGKLNNKDFYTMGNSLSAITSIDISGTNAESIPDDMFKNKYQLKEFVSPATMRKIGNNAFLNCSQLKTIPFSNNIDTIGANAFQSCNNMSGNIVFPEKFSFLGSCAFNSCNTLTAVDLSACKNLTRIEYQTFSYCSTLKSVILPTSVYSISSYAFSGCSSLNTVLFPASLSYIENNAFSECSSLTSIDLSKCANLTYLNNDNIFGNCSSLKSIILPPSITNIGNVFSGCSALESFTVLSSKVPTVQSNTLASVPLASCILYVPKGSEQTYLNADYWGYFDTVKGIGILPRIGSNGTLLAGNKTLQSGQVFFHQAKEITLVPNPNPGYQVDAFTIDDKQVETPDKYVMSAGTVGATVNVTFKLKKFNLEITKKGNGTLKYENRTLETPLTLSVDSASSARFVLLPDEGYAIDTLTYNGQNCIVQQDSVFNTPRIQADATMSVSFVSASSLGNTYKISVSTGANGYVKYNNTPLLPETSLSVKEDETAAFTILPDETYMIDKVWYNGTDATDKVVNGVFTPENLTANASLKVAFCINPIVAVTEKEPGTLSRLLTKAQCPAITNLTVSGTINTNDFYFMRDSIKGLSVLNLSNATIADSGNTIPNSAFQNHQSLTKVQLPLGIVGINSSAFFQCTKLNSVNLEACASLSQIESTVFQYCNALASVHLPVSITKLGSYSFGGCNNLISVTIDAKVPPTLDYMNNNAFGGSPISLVFVPKESVSAYKAAQIWKDYAVISTEASSLTVDVPTAGMLSYAITQKGVALTDVGNLIVTGTLNSEDFRIMNKSMTQLTSIDLSGTTVEEIPASAFENKVQLLSFKAPATIKRIGDKAFSGCRLLKELPLGDKINSIGAHAFEACASLIGKLTLPATLTTLSEYAFNGCSGLDSLDMKACKSLVNIPVYGFGGCAGLKSVEFAPSISNISDYAFANCQSLIRVDLSQSTYLNLSNGAFQACGSLQEVLLPSSIQNIADQVFIYCSKLASLKVYASSVPNIQANSFTGVNLNNCILTVPTGSAKTYGLASNWASFANIHEMGIQTLIGKNGKVTNDGQELTNGQVIFHNSAEVNLAVAPNPGYEVESLKFNNQSVEADNGIYKIPAGTQSGAFNATFKLKKFGLSVTVDAQGALKYGDALLSDTVITLPVDSASSAKFTIIPAEGYAVDSIHFNNQLNVAQKGNSVYATPYLTGPSSLIVHFVPKSDLGTVHKIDVFTGANGYVEYVNTPMLPDTTDITIKDGSPALFTIKPAEGYLLNKVVYNGTDVTAKVTNNQYTIASITAGGKLEVSFRVNPVLSVNVKTPGSLSQLISADQKKGVTNLTLTGTINSIDFYFMRDNMDVLSVLDMRQVKVGDIMMAAAYESYEIPGNAFSTDYSNGKKTLTEVYLPLNIKYIRDNAFYNCSNLRVVNLEECKKLISISSNAFNNTAIKSVTLPDSLTEMYYGAFAYCQSLERVDLSATKLTTIRNYSFGSNSKLQSVLFPKNITTIEDCAFQSCYALKSFDLSACKVLTSIGRGAFGSCQLQSLIVPASLKSIGDNAFQSCSALKSVDLSACTNLLSIGNALFNGCGSLITVRLPATLLTIGADAFSSCGIVGTIELPASVTTIGENAFNYNSKLAFCKAASIVPPALGNTVFPSAMAAVFVPEQSIAAYEAATGWKDYDIIGGEQLVTVHVAKPGTLATSIMDQTGKAPREITGMTVTGDLNATDFENIRTNMPLLYSLDLSGTDVLIIPEGAFRDKTILMHFIAPADLVEIKPNAFQNCTNLMNTLVIPDGVITIGSNAFSNCNSLIGLKLSKYLMTIGDNAFTNCNALAQKLELPRKLKNIGNNAFSGCTALTDTLTLPENLETIGSNTFQNCNKIKYADLSLCENIRTIPSYLFSGCTSLSSVALSNKVTDISDNVFSNCTSLEEIQFPATLASVGSYAFNHCAALKRVDFSGCKLLNSMGSEVFSDCPSLTTINLSPVLMKVGSRAFANDVALANISTMNDTPATLESDVFYKVRTKKCVLSIPKNAYNTYLNASQWGSFVQLSKNVDVELTAGGTVSFESIDTLSTTTISTKADIVIPRLSARSAANVPLSIDGASLESGARICILDNQALKFYIAPSDGGTIEKVMYNNEDVTDQVENGVFVTPLITTKAGSLVVEFSGRGGTGTDTGIENTTPDDKTTKIYSTFEALCVENDNEMSGVEVYNINGQMVYKTKEHNTSYRIERLTKGIFIVRVYLSDGKFETLRVVKN